MDSQQILNGGYGCCPIDAWFRSALADEVLCGGEDMIDIEE